MEGSKIIEQAKTVFNSKIYKEIELKYYDDVKNGYWIAACLNEDWIGLSRDMIIKEHKSRYGKYYSHHCPNCDGICYNPKEAVNDPIYEFNEG